LANAFGGIAFVLASLRHLRRAGVSGRPAALGEIVFDVALGSTRAGILKLVLREGFQLVAIGMFLGIVRAISLQKAVRQRSLRCPPLDPLVLASVMALLALIALAGAPSRASRNARRPIVALRYDSPLPNWRQPLLE